MLESSNTGHVDDACYEEVDTSLQGRAYPSHLAEDTESIEMTTNIVYAALTAREVEMTSNVAYATTGGLQYYQLV